MLTTAELLSAIKYSIMKAHAAISCFRLLHELFLDDTYYINIFFYGQVDAFLSNLYDRMS